ncbi:hypothetical protein CCACVL1_06264 [Corchorus capsularis]|uniref:ABC transporter-like protein n=1 Tax=Corchorus capsularis TaxID=210143 RepID=A0A1R3JGF8_COCAP|nr:hypothetical protein CCACVL1_06264 [Corchorus capsularis]
METEMEAAEDQNKNNKNENENNNNNKKGVAADEQRVPFYKLFEFADRLDLVLMVVGTISAIGNGLAQPIMSLIFGQMINSFGASDPSHVVQEVSKIAIKFVYLGIYACIVAFLPLLKEKVCKSAKSMQNRGAIGARLSTDASTVKNLVGDTLALIVQNISTITAGLIIAFTANWKLTLAILAVVPLMLAQGFIQAKFLKGFSGDAKVMYEEASQVANDAVRSIRTVASFCSEKKVMDLYQQKCKGPMEQGVRIGLVSGSGFGFSFLAIYLTNAFCFYIGALLVKRGQATFGEVLKVFFALTISALGVSQTSALAPDTNKAKDSAASIFEILDRRPRIDSSSDSGSTLATVTGNIELEHVSFKYPTRPDIQIFRDMCLSIPSGKTVALVGESGSGKSTVISLIQRFYDPDSGRLTLDGMDLKRMKLSWLRQQMGLVSQEPILFNETIRENIAYGKEGHATEEEITAAAKASNAHNFISSLPQGYDTSVGERGVQLSGGQKQRIAIARAILKDPKILLLDEATSALDAESERVVQEALDRVMVNRTTVVVAHRLSTIKNADIIAVVKNGVIAEKGRHDALMKITDGAYASLVALHMSAT